MTTLEPASAPTTSSEVRRLRLLCWTSPLAVVLSAVVWNAGAAMLDASPVQQNSGSWGYSFATMIYTVVVGAPLLVLVTLAAGLAHVAAPAARGVLVAGVVVCALTGFVLGVMGVVLLFTGVYDGDIAFAVVTFVASAVLLAPGWLAWDAVVRR